MKWLKYSVLVASLLAMTFGLAVAQTLIIGNDNKQGVDQNFKPILREPGHDTLSILDISKPDAPRITATIPLDQLGRRTADQSGDHALGRHGAGRQFVGAGGPGLGPSPGARQQGVCRRPESEPAQDHRHGHRRQAALGSGDQPAGRHRTRCQSRRRHDLGAGIRGKEVLVIGTVPIGAPEDQVSAVAITPDGKHALAT